MLFNFHAIKAYFQVWWYLTKIFFGIMRGIWKISNLKCAPISIFGGTFLAEDSIYMEQARMLAHKLVEHGVPVLTGGGPGIMQAAQCGAKESVDQHKERAFLVSSIGISVKGLDKGFINKCASNTIIIDHFTARKFLLMDYSVGFAIFPGGFGTLNEFTEILTLVQTKLTKKMPIVLIGKDYWGPVMDWINNCACKNGLISLEDTSLFSVTDDIDEAFELLKVKCVKTLSVIHKT